MKRLTLLMIFSILAMVCESNAKPVPEEELKAYEYDIIRLAIEQVNRDVNPLAIVNKYKISLPILPPRLDHDQVAALVRKEIELRVSAKFPMTRLKEIEKEAEEKFRLYKVGDKVSIEVIDVRRHVKMTLNRYIREITGRGVRLGDDFFSFTDVSRKEYPHFFRDAHQRAIEQYIKVQTGLFKEAREKYEKQVRKEIEAKIWRDEGYVFVKRLRKWVPREELVQKLIEKEWMKKFESIKSDVEVLVLEKNGYVWDEQNGYWESKEDAEREAQEKAAQGETGEKAGKVAKKKIGSILSKWGSEIQKVISSGDKKKNDDLWNDDDEKEAPKKEPEGEKK
ncbi:MAG: hypothetical protein D6820_03745 [Lentisphaerae bacterium]|nr:MAG: hypothetical protein D6820_03745 [Lentisphaerota bacterium]